MVMDYSEFIRTKIKNYNLSNILFTKQNLLDWLADRNNCNIKDLMKEILDLKYLIFVDKQIAIFEGQKEERYRCYFIYSNKRGRCYILNLNGIIKIITVFPLGRTTLRKYKKRFK